MMAMVAGSFLGKLKRAKFIRQGGTRRFSETQCYLTRKGVDALLVRRP